MSVSLLLPGALAALAVLVLPVLLHLARRDQQQPLDFAALRWLPGKVQPRNRLRLEDLPLLLLRLLLLTLLVLWLAQPVMYGATDRRPYVAVMPGVSAATVTQQHFLKDVRMHWLAVGLPAWDAALPSGVQPIDSLLRQLDAELPAEAPLIVLATPQFDGADAQLPVLSHRVDWRIVTDTAPVPPPAQRMPAPRLYIMVDAAHQAQSRYLAAAAQAWQVPATQTATTATLPANTQAVVVWLSSAALPSQAMAWVRDGGTLLLTQSHPLPGTPLPLWVADDGVVLLEASAQGQGRLLRWTRPLQPAVMPQLLEADFPQHLRAALQAPTPAPVRADARTHQPQWGGRSTPQPPQALQPWLALLLALLFLSERWLATRQRAKALQ
ncbi:MAG TPA: BatA domain-containing protein [Thermomonas sp.]|jgi:hypothetical protein|uniref:BatA domain-containing protein n=1 Tax=Thermomonas sp. TaxID=1971895 RepID=UPI002BDA7C01|nr:BatA domain-containing protein [Thermomonas sp.]HOV95789.1 BatA domain-containing protein [Thermomonas sp.]